MLNYRARPFGWVSLNPNAMIPAVYKGKLYVALPVKRYDPRTAPTSLQWSRWPYTETHTVVSPHALTGGWVCASQDAVTWRVVAQSA